MLQDPRGGSVFITGKRRYDLWLFVGILFCMLLTGYRLRVYYSFEPVQPEPPRALR